MTSAKQGFINLIIPAFSAGPARGIEENTTDTWSLHGNHEALGLSEDAHQQLAGELKSRKDMPGDNTITWKGPRPS